MSKPSLNLGSGKFDLNTIDFFSVMDNLDEGVIITDNQGIIYYYNDTQAQIDDLEQEFVLGKKITDLYDLTDDTSQIMLCMRIGRPIRNVTFFYKTKSGKVANTIHSIFPIFANSKISGAVCFVKDYKILRNTTPVISVPDLRPVKENGTRYTFADIIGHNQELVRSVFTSRTAADSSSPIMLIGETGTGKELFAQSIHNHSSRSKNYYVAVNCAAIPENLLEGLLFGTVRGAFTGAMDKPGLLEQANGSTLFLDELLSMPVALQAKLLRVIQEKKVRRIGSGTEQDLNIKIISSVNKPPREAVVNNELRIDLFYRIGVVMVKIPPLRERLDDLPDLVNHFLITLNNRLGTNVKAISNDVMNLFQSYQWPGNIREIEHLLEGAMNIVGFDDMLSSKHFTSAFDCLERIPTHPATYTAPPIPPHLRTAAEDNSTPNDQQYSLKERQSVREREALYEVLNETRGNISKASVIIGVSRQLLRYKMKKHGFVREQFTNP